MVQIIFWLFLATSASAQTIDLGDLEGPLPTEETNPFGPIDTSQWDGLYENPEGMNACPDPAHCESLLDLMNSTPDLDVPELRQSLDGLLGRDDPMSIVGDLFGNQAVCDAATGDTTVKEVVVEDYACHASYESTDYVDSCSAPLEVQVDVDYEYSCSVPDPEFCSSPQRQNRQVVLANIFVDYGEYDQLPPDEYLPAFRDHIAVPNCYVNHGEVYEDVDVDLEYICYEGFDYDPALFAGDIVIEQYVNCMDASADGGPTCDTLEATPGCNESGGAYCDGTTSSVESLHCIPDGQVVGGLTCDRERIHELEVLFEYECNYIYDEQTGELVPDPKCNDLVNDPSCGVSDSECVESADIEYEEVSCQVGAALSYEDLDCVSELYGIGFVEYLYSYSEIFDADTDSFETSAESSIKNDDRCRFESRECVVEAPEVFEERTCREGYEDVDTSYECSIIREITVDDDYVYGTRRTWDALTGKHEVADTFRVGLTETCDSLGQECEIVTPPSYEEHICLSGYRFEFSDQSCALDRVVVVDTDYIYHGLESFDYGLDLFVKNASFSTLENEASCRVNGRSCTGDSVTQYDRDSCQVGTIFDAKDEVVTRERIVEVDTDYYYKSYSNFVVGTGFVDQPALVKLESENTCNLISEVCVEEGPGVFSSYSCQIGYTEGFTAQECLVPIVVRTDSDYIYQASEVYTNSGFVLEPELVSLRNSNVCSLQERTCVQDSPGVFEDHSCDVGFEREYTDHVFRREGEPRYDLDYVYAGTRSWTGAKSAELVSLETDGTCELTGSVCSEVTPPPFAVHTCTQGYQNIVEDMSCERERVIEVDLDYSYTVNRVWNTSSNVWTGEADWNAVRSSAATAASCQKTAETCQADSPGVFTQHTCQSGYKIEQEAMSCTYELGFTTETDYQYTGYENWNGSAFADDTTLVSIGQQASSKTCVRESVTNQLPLSIAERTSKYQCVAGSITYSDSSTCEPVLELDWYWKLYQVRYGNDGDDDPANMEDDCEFLRYESSGGDYDDVYFLCPVGYNSNGVFAYDQHVRTARTTWNYSSCQAQVDAGDPLTADVCIEGASTKTISAQSQTLSRYETCWKKRRTYGSSVNKAINSCSPPPNFDYKRQTSYTGSPALGTSRSLQLKTYEKVESLANAANIVSDYACFTGYWTPSSGANKTYACSPPSGAVQKSSVCAWNDSSNVCRLWAKSYSIPNSGPTGGYKRKKEVWSCDTQITGSGVSSPQLLKSFKEWVWWESNTCTAKLASYPEGCTLNTQGYTGPNTTKTVDGHSITRQFTYGQNYTCNVRENIDTCESLLATNEYSDDIIQYASLDLDLALPGSKGSSVGNKSPPEYLKLAALGDYTYDGRTCLNYEGAVCTLWENRYDREETDGSGGCLTQQETWLCENAISGAGTPAISREITSEKWEWPSADCQAKVAQYDSCVYQNQTQDLGTADTRVIDGLSVTRSSWILDRNYVCTRTDETNSCGSVPSNASVEDVQCQWTDSQGICRLADYVYHELLPDPTNGCTTHTDTYLCETRNHGAEIDTVREVSSIAYPLLGDHREVNESDSCVRTKHFWTDGAEPRIDEYGLSAIPRAGAQWALQSEYRCHEDSPVQTCEVPAGSVLVGSECLSSLDDGSCSYERQDYQLELPDPSGGCYEWQEEYLCSDQVSVAGTPVAIPTVETGSEEDRNLCQVYDTDDSCEVIGRVCTQGPETRRVNGIDVFKSCWAWRDDFECVSRTEFDTCSPEPTAVLDEESCAFTDRDGECTLFDRVYLNEEHDPSGGCNSYESSFLCQDEVTSLVSYDTKKAIVREYYDPAPLLAVRDQYQSCSYIADSRVYQPRETRVVDGLELSRFWEASWTYDCYNSERVDTCNFGVDAVLLETTCAQTYRDVCSLEEKLYDVVLTDSSGGCQEYTTEYFCEEAVSGLTPEQEIKTIESDKYDLTACNTLEADFDVCTFESEACGEGPETRTIDGLEVTRECWSVDRDVSCRTSEHFNTCTVPPTAVRNEISCAWHDAGGICRLFENRYDVELPDLTGGCTTFLEKFVCEDTFDGPELIDTVKHVESDEWNFEDCDNDADTVGSCSIQSTVCAGEAETRTIDGLEVSLGCWEQTRQMSCSRRDVSEGCEQYAESGEPEQACLWTDSGGNCRLFENTYQVSVLDGSGGCHEWSNSYWCNYVSDDHQASDTLVTVTGTEFDNQACSDITTNNEVVDVSETCTDQSPALRSPLEVRGSDGEILNVSAASSVTEISAPCWEISREYTVETSEQINTCVGEVSPLCSLESSECSQEKYNGGDCSLQDLSYSCGIEGSDYCEIQENTFSCVGPATASSSQLSNLNGNLSEYTPSDITARVVNTYLDNSVCTEAISFGSCVYQSQKCIDSGTGPRPVANAQDEYFQQFVGYAEPQSHGCWKMERTFDCTAPDNPGYCDGRSDSCSANSSNCLHHDENGNCLMSVDSFACETDGGVCSDSSQDYVCEDPVEGHEPVGTTEPEVTSEYNMDQCDNVGNDNDYCREPEVVCSAGGGTRHFEPGHLAGQSSDFTLEPTDTSVPVSSECWEYENSYECTEVGEAATDCQPEENCELVGEVCLGEGPDGECVTTEYNYECTSVETVVVSEGQPGTCEPLEEDPTPPSPANSSINQLSALMSLGQADRETGGDQFVIFDGSDKRCGRDILGVKNCCKDSGVLLSLGLGSCSDEEIELAVQKDEDRCVSIGSYCSKKTFFGTCLKRKETYCCFEAEIGRIVAEAGREQLGRDFGTPKDPECGGFSVVEFQSLDLSAVDFSSITSDVMGNLVGEDTSQYEDTLTDRINGMTNGGGG